jgi:hypothetical protein
MELFNLKNQDTVHVVVLACSKCGKLKTIRTRAGERPWY